MGRVVVVVEPLEDHPFVDALTARYDVEMDAVLDVYRGVLMDLFVAGAGSTGDLAAAVPTDGEAAVEPQQLLEDAIGAAGQPILEYDPASDLIQQIIGEESGALTIVFPRTPFVRRTHLDSAAMRLRRHDVVVGPSARGGLCSLAVSDRKFVSVTAMESDLLGVVRGAVENDGSVDFLAPWPAMTSPDGVTGTRALLDAYEVAGRDVAPFTRAALSPLSPRSNR